jgi:hypothetical protein
VDRTIAYPGSLPRDTDLLFAEVGAMVGQGYLAQAMLGTSVAAVGLACAPTSPASMQVTVGPGAMTGYTEVDTTAFGSLGTNTNPLVKLGVNQAATSFTLTAPTTSGQSINYLIEGQFQETDNTAIVLPYYNAANPLQPYAGPGNSGTAQNTVRQQLVGLQLKAGAAATTGTQTTPGADSGWSPLYVITVNYGQTSVTSSSISVAQNAPFISGGSIIGAIADASAVAGSMRNLVMAVSAASATAVITADEVVVSSGLGSLAWKIGSFSASINIATTGAGGMDTGSAPTSGFVAIYAIYNPGSGAYALLATNASSSAAPTVYGGANMPSGYTASALVSVWPTTSGGLLAVAVQHDRSVYGLNITLLTSSTAQASRTVLTSSTIPPNAKRIGGAISSFVGTAGALSLINLYPSTASGFGAATQSSCPGASGATQTTPFEMPVMTAQTLYYTASVSGTGTTFTYSLGFVSYDF